MTRNSGSARQVPIEETFETDRGLLDQIAERTGLVGREEDPENASILLAAYLDAVLKETTIPEEHYVNITEQISKIDALLSIQLDEILHHPEFQSLEATWRGIDRFVRNTIPSPMIQIKLINAEKKELYRDLKAGPFKSRLYKKIYQEEYGVLGGKPYGVLIGDYEFSHTSSDVELLRNLASVASVSHAPLIAGTSPSMFNRDDFSELEDVKRLGRIFEDNLYEEWNAFRKSEDARYVALVLPHVLVRPPYNPDNNPVEGLSYNEDITVEGEENTSEESGTRGQRRAVKNRGKGDKRKLLWGSAAMLLAERLTDAFSNYEWCTRIRGVEGGGVVEDAPVCTFPTGDGGPILVGPAEIIIPDDHENQMSQLGFLPLCQNKGEAEAVFMSGQTCQLPIKLVDPEENASAELSAKLPYMLAVSRFAHFVKVMMRDKIGSFASPSNCQAFLTKWIAQYVEPSEDANEQQKAKKPLHAARIIVKRVAGRPGVYEAEMFLLPHFQLEEFKVAIRLVAELPKSLGKP